MFFANRFNWHSGASDQKARYSQSAVAFQFERQLRSVNISDHDRGNCDSLEHPIYIILFYTAPILSAVLLSRYRILHRCMRSCLFLDMSDSVGLPPFLILSLLVPFYELDNLCFLCGDFPLFMVELLAYRYRPYLVTSLVYFYWILDLYQVQSAGCVSIARCEKDHFICLYNWASHHVYGRDSGFKVALRWSGHISTQSRKKQDVAITWQSMKEQHEGARMRKQWWDVV
jgi:hypothetical protein